MNSRIKTRSSSRCQIFLPSPWFAVGWLAAALLVACRGIAEPASTVKRPECGVCIEINDHDVADMHRIVVMIGAQGAPIGDLPRRIVQAIPYLLTRADGPFTWVDVALSIRVLGSLRVVAVPEDLGNLYEVMWATSIPALRAECARYLGLTDPGFVTKVIERSESSGSKSVGVEILIMGRVRDVLLSRLSRSGGDDGIVESAAVGYGWQIIDGLERAGRADLVDQALLNGWKPYVAMGEFCDSRWRAGWVEQGFISYRVIVDETWSDSAKARLYMLHPSGRGAVLTHIEFDKNQDPAEWRVRNTLLDDRVGRIFARQVACLIGIEATFRDAELAESISSLRLEGRVLCELDGKLQFDAAFADYACGDNIQDRLKVEAVLRMIGGLGHEAEWVNGKLSLDEMRSLEGFIGGLGYKSR
jgi:hypothetical protein